MKNARVCIYRKSVVLVFVDLDALVGSEGAEEARRGNQYKVCAPGPIKEKSSLFDHAVQQELR